MQSYIIMLLQPSMTTEYDAYYAGYISLVTVPMQQLNNQLTTIVSFLSEHKNRLDYKYAEGKWSIREVLMHICDVEVIFMNRMLRASRGDGTPLPSFDHDAYVADNNFDHIDVDTLIEHYSAIRNMTISHVKTLHESTTMNTGVASGSRYSVRAMIYIATGHCQHHLNILKERYT